MKDMIIDNLILFLAYLIFASHQAYRASISALYFLRTAGRINFIEAVNVPLSVVKSYNIKWNFWTLWAWDVAFLFASFNPYSIIFVKLGFSFASDTVVALHPFSARKVAEFFYKFPLMGGSSSKVIRQVK